MWLHTLVHIHVYTSNVNFFTFPLTQQVVKREEKKKGLQCREAN